jgi:hypothetical protein
MEATQKGVTLEDLQKHKTTDFLPLNGTDYIEFYIYLYSGSGTISAGSAETQCSGVWIRS